LWADGGACLAKELGMATRLSLWERRGPILWSSIIAMAVEYIFIVWFLYFRELVINYPRIPLIDWELYLNLPANMIAIPILFIWFNPR